MCSGNAFRILWQPAFHIDLFLSESGTGWVIKGLTPLEFCSEMANSLFGITKVRKYFIAPRFFGD